MPVNSSIEVVSTRSSQAGLLALIEGAAAEVDPPQHPAATRADSWHALAFCSSGKWRGTQTIEQIAAEHWLLDPPHCRRDHHREHFFWVQP